MSDLAVAGIILAGGRSRRMGSDKALLPYEGSVLLDHVCRALLAVTHEVILVSEAAETYVDAPLHPAVRRVGDLYPGQGPLGGIVTGLRAAGEGVHLVVACDMPRIAPGLLRLLLTSVEGHDAAVPEVAGRLQPLCAAYTSRCVERLEAKAQEGERAVHRAIAALDFLALDESAIRAVDPDLVSFTNVNTPDQYSNLLS